MGNPAAGDLFPGSLAGSIVGAAWAASLALLLGAAALGVVRRWEAQAPHAEDDGWLRGLEGLVVGFALLSSGWLLLSAAHQLQPRAVVGTAAVLTVVGLAATLAPGSEMRALARQARDSARFPRWRALTGADRGLLLAAVLALAVAFGVFARLALLPSLFYDDLVYHLGLPRQALLVGAWPALPEFHHSFLPAAWDANYVLPLALGGGSGPQLLETIATAALALAVARLARQGGSPAAAAASTALLLLAPMFVVGSPGTELEFAL